ncbi:MAG: DMT family transporter [Calditrichaeota bacterium]|nr:MAG: DMT family transporter [Calditrichota bacterium]
MFYGWLLAILTGIFFGLQGTYGKILAHRFPTAFLTWASFVFPLPFLFILLFQEGIPPVQWKEFIWATGVSFLVNVVAWYVFFRALAASPIHLTLPFTAFTPLFMIPMAYVLLGELPHRRGVLGILLIIGGAYGIHSGAGGWLQPLLNLFRERGTRYMLFVALIWSVSATVEKVAVLSSSPSFYAVVIFALLGLAYLPYVLVGYRENLLALRSYLGPLALWGVITGLMIICQFSALQYLPASYVIAFKRAGVIVGVILGYLLWKENNPVKNTLFTAIIIAGALLIML